MQKSYRVLEAAGPWVAGVRNPGKGKTIKLTAEQAQYAVIAGELRTRPPTRPRPSTPTSRPRRRKADPCAPG
ncbi:MAG: hypothetical protein HPM95_13060 [Alphaproteobacteria bacterium]|nr:hypothetical protein [Alphaproteobacteria bacterium]